MKKILLAEDDKFLANALKVKLTKVGFDVTVARDGEEALEHLKNLTPDLIVLDLVMPKLDGFGTLERIRANDNLKHVPVLITSNLGQKEDIDKTMKMGANGYLVKSDVGLEKIIQKINSMVS